MWHETKKMEEAKVEETAIRRSPLRPPPQILPPLRWRPGTAGTRTPGRSCCSRPR